MSALTGVLDRLAGRRPGRPDADRGAVAMTVSMLLGSGVLLGFLALVVDVGQLYVERTQLQSSADAAALGIARACANHTTGCDNFGAVSDVAEHYANANSSDGVTNVAEVCGRHEGMLPSCSEAATNHTACLGVVPSTGSYVEVRVSTQVPGDRFVLPPTFAQAMAGNEDFDGASIGACARAAWGSDELTILAMTISMCEMDDGYDYGSEYLIEFYQGTHDDCRNEPEPEPWREAGEAGFLDGGGANCRIRMSPDGVVTGDFFRFFPGELAPASCEDRVRRARANGEEIYLPVHDARAGSDGDPRFRHVYVAPFVISGFQFGAPVRAGDPPYDPDDHRERSNVTNQHPCPQLYHRCISGEFTGPPVPVSSLTGETYVRLIG